MLTRKFRSLIILNAFTSKFQYYQQERTIFIRNHLKNVFCPNPPNLGGQVSVLGPRFNSSKHFSMSAG
jgi:hypothetical protein